MKIAVCDDDKGCLDSMKRTVKSVNIVPSQKKGSREVVCLQCSLYFFNFHLVCSLLIFNCFRVNSFMFVQVCKTLCPQFPRFEYQCIQSGWVDFPLQYSRADPYFPIGAVFICNWIRIACITKVGNSTCSVCGT